MATGNSMLAVPDKKTTAVDLYHPLRHYIAVAFGEREAQEAEDDLNAIWRLRLDLEKPIEAAASDLRRDLLLTYYRALASIETRFPISPDPIHVHSLTFTWFDAFKPSKKVAQTSIHLEKAAIIFNLGSVYSQIALSANRTDAAGLKQACNAFQSAAGAFAYLRDNAAARVSSTGGVTVDLSVECAWMLEKLMLAQAQECFFEKVIGDAKPPALCSKVARQVGLYYEEAYAVLNSPPLNQHFDRSWIAHVQSKAAQFYAEASYRCSLDLHDKEEIAEEICRLRTAINALADAKKYSRGVAQPLLDAVNKLETKMTRNLERAIKENEQVYLMRVPDASSLAPLSSASLVKPMPLAEVLDASKEGLFSRLVPDNDTKALSKYTDIVDGIIRMQAEKLQQASEIARVRLKEMGLPDSILALEGSFDLPLDFKEDVEALQVRGGPSGLETELQQLKDLRGVNQRLCIEIEELLNKEADEDAHFRSQFGTKWNRPQSSILTKGLQDRLNKFAANIKQAIDSDSRIERAVRDNSSLMAILDNKPIESAIPNLARPIMSLDGNEDAIVGALKQSLRQIENLGAQRAGLEDMLKEMKGKDDILPKMMASTGSQEDLFKKEISKYDQICEEIVQNIEEQDQLLLQIQAQNDEFSVVFNLEDYKAAREKILKQISTAITKYHEIKENINEGLNFYVTLQDAVTNIKQQCSDFVMTRNIQCQEMVENLQRQSNSYPHSAAQSAPPHVEQPQPGYSHLYTSYATPQQTTPYLIPSGQYQPSLQQSNQPTAYPGWRGGSYYLPQQQASPAPPPPYTTPSPYPPPNQGSYYRPQ